MSEQYEYPRDYAITALWFLSADDEARLSYLPGPFPLQDFECSHGIFKAENALFVMLHACREAVYSSAVWEEWDEAESFDAVRKGLFLQLHDVVNRMLCLVDARGDHRAGPMRTDPGWGELSASSASLVEAILGRMSPDVRADICDIVPCNAILLERTYGTFRAS